MPATTRIYLCCPHRDAIPRVVEYLSAWGIEVVTTGGVRGSGAAAVLVVGPGVDNERRIREGLYDREIVEGIDAELPVFHEVKSLIKWIEQGGSDVVL